MKTTKRERDAELARQFLSSVGWADEFHPVPGIDQLVLDRFWSKVELRDGHWLWTRSLTASGRGQFAVHPRLMFKCHRLAWQLMRGEIEDGLALVSRESCEHDHCINPDCHALVTEAEARSIGGKRGGRGRLKSRPGGIRLMCSQRVIDILAAMHEQGHELPAIHAMGRKAGLGPTAVQHIIKGNAVGVR